MSEPSASIVVDKLTKRFRGANTAALDAVSLAVRPGEVYGFLGPNGAGKSTTIRLLMNFIQPTEGKASILDKDIVKDSVTIKRSIGYLAGDFDVYPKMTGRQYLAYMQDMQPVKDKTYADKLVERLKADLDRPLGMLSRGNRQKIGILQAFMHQPQVLILDEPTSGLDPLMQEVFFELIDEARARNATVFVSSHILSEVQRMCDRVGIIRAGKLVTERDMREMATEAAQTFDIVFAGKVPAGLGKIRGVKVTDTDGDKVTIHVHGKLAPLFAFLSKHDVVKIDARNLDLEELFLGFYQDEEGGK
jgi:ABC-2 type transport system ATP-binding protein